MDREISKEVQRKEQRKQFIRIGTAVGGFIVLIVVVISMLQTSLKRKDLNISTVDKGVIEVSVSASGKVIPAFEEIINSPINSRIVEVYKRGGDSVDVGTPILKLDLQSAETEYNKQLDKEQTTNIFSQRQIKRTDFFSQTVLFYNLSSIFTIGCNIIVIMNLILM